MQTISFSSFIKNMLVAEKQKIMSELTTPEESSFNQSFNSSQAASSSSAKAATASIPALTPASSVQESVPALPQATPPVPLSIPPAPAETQKSPETTIEPAPASNPLPSVNETDFSLSPSVQYDDLIKSASAKYDVPEQLIKKIIQTESNFDPNAVSYAGAQGLMQLMPATADWLGVSNPFNPAQNIEGGVKYLSQLLDKYDGNVTKAVAAYNAGPGNVDKYNGIPPFIETQNYVKKVLGT